MLLLRYESHIATMDIIMLQQNNLTYKNKHRQRLRIT